ncbi:MAG TPA: hypothetical protein VHE61_06865 [Opitutaceae bacterium]|nr:hypothetical protein [Opitutaceae bacterium]
MVNDPASGRVDGSVYPENLQHAKQELLTLLADAKGRFFDQTVAERLDFWRLSTASALAETLKAKKTASVIELAQELLRELVQSGANDFGVAQPSRDRAAQLMAQGWGGVAAATLLVPAWQTTSNPSLRDAPLWLTPLLAQYYFCAPTTVTSARQADSYARVHLAALQDLVAMAKANRASPAVKSAVEHYVQNEVPPVLNLAPAFAGPVRSARGRLVAALDRAAPQLEIPATARTDRPLRVGLVARSLDTTRNVLSLLAFVERLPRSRFEVVICVRETSDSAVERQLLGRGAASVTLTGDAEEMAQLLRDASLDVAVLVPGERWIDDPIIALSLRRFAPLQIIHDGTGSPTDLAQIDVFIAGPGATSAGAAKSADRPALPNRTGPIARNELRPAAVPPPWTREMLGIPDGGFVFGAFVELPAIALETVEMWTAVLKASGDSRLVVISRAACELGRFCAQLSAWMTAQGINPARVGVFTDVEFATHDERVSALGAISTLLDSSATSNPEMVLAAIAAGCPVVAWAEPASGGAALLRDAGFADLIGQNAGEVAAIAVRTDSDRTWRQSVVQRLADTAPQVLARFDSFATSERFAEVVEQAFDERLASPRDFRAGPALRTVATADVAVARDEAGMFLQIGAPADAERVLRLVLARDETTATDRKLLATALSRQGAHGDAADLLVSVVELAPADPSNWFDLGLAARQAGRPALAVQAFQTGVRIEPRRTESWKILAELADELGNEELRREIAAVLQQIEPVGAIDGFPETLRAATGF